MCCSTYKLAFEINMSLAPAAVRIQRKQTFNYTTKVSEGANCSLRRRIHCCKDSAGSREI